MDKQVDTSSKPACIKDASVCRLDHLGLIRVSGADAQQFLSNLLSCKICTEQDHLQLCTICNPKGRIISCFTAFCKGADIYLQMPTELIAQTIAYLKKYVLMSKVELDDVTAELVSIGYIATLPNALDDRTTVFRAPGNLVERYIAYTPADYSEQLQQQAMESGCRAVSHHVWHCCDIAEGIPSIYLATSEQLTPQMINLDLLGAISFSKGCYPGQEIIARTHYLGKLKRRAYLFTVESCDVEAGIPVYVEGEEEPCGQIVDSCSVEDRYAIALASIKIKSLNAQLHIKLDSNVVPLTLEKMPYSVTETSFDAEAQ